jgi:hypothetical protein
MGKETSYDEYPVLWIDLALYELEMQNFYS